MLNSTVIWHNNKEVVKSKRKTSVWKLIASVRPKNLDNIVPARVRFTLAYIHVGWVYDLSPYIIMTGFLASKRVSAFLKLIILHLSVCSSRPGRRKRNHSVGGIFTMQNTSHWPNAGLMLGRRRRCWPNIKSTLAQYLGVPVRITC